MRTTDNGYFLFVNVLRILSYAIQNKMLLSNVYTEIDSCGYIFAQHVSNHNLIPRCIIGSFYSGRVFCNLL